MVFPELTPESFDFFARYVLSGFVIYWIRSLYVLEERPGLSEILLEILIFSLVNQLAWQVVTALAAATGGALGWGVADRPGVPRFVFLAEVLLLPIVLGLLLGLAIVRSGADRVARTLSIPVTGAYRRAYDEVFLSRSNPAFVLLTFADGSRVAGYYGRASRAGRDPDRSEVFLERLYQVPDEGRWVEADPPRSALIRLDGLQMIEFFEVPDDD